MYGSRIIEGRGGALRYLTAIAIVLSLVLMSCGSDNGYGGGGGTVILLSVRVTPVNPSVGVAGNQQFTATGTYSNYVTTDITAQASWSSSDSNVAMVGNVAGTKGLATCTAPGSVTITASLGYLSGMTTLTCS